MISINRGVAVCLLLLSTYSCVLYLHVEMDGDVEVAITTDYVVSQPLRVLEENVMERCRFVAQNPVEAVDEHGFLCSVEGQDRETDCCADKSRRFTCQVCNATSHCCSSFETCVSCCLSPANNNMKSVLTGRRRAYLSTLTDPFDFCSAVCRTSSLSLWHENMFINDKQKNCYA